MYECIISNMKIHFESLLLLLISVIQFFVVVILVLSCH